MNVCVLTPWHVRCGIATYSEALVEGLAQEECKVYVARVHRFSLKNQKYFETLALRRIPKVDVIHVQHEYGIYTTGPGMEETLYNYLKVHNVPVVTTMHATGIYRDIDQVIIDGNDAVVVHNKWMEDQLSIPSSKVKTIPHGCQPMQTMAKDTARSLLGLPRDKFIAANFGVLSQYKGVEEVFRAMQAVPDMILLITGGWHVNVKTKYADEMKKLAERILPDRVVWLGWVPSDKLPLVFGAADVCIDNHKLASESGSLLTCMGYGKCCVTSNHPAFKEKTKWVMTHRGAEDLANIFIRLRDNPSIVEDFEKRSKAYAEEHSWRETAKKHIELYKELM